MTTIERREKIRKIKGVYLQNYLYLSCFLSFTTELGTKLMQRMAPLVNSLTANYLIYIFIDINEDIRNKRGKT